jgi:glycogen synthase
MKVLLVGDYPPPYGGIAVHLQQVHRFLRSQGITARVLNIGKGDCSDPEVISTRKAWRYAFELSKLSSQGWLAHLHVSGNNSKAWWVVGSVGGFSWSTPPVVTVHSGRSPEFLARNRLRRILARAALSRYGTVIAVSVPVKRALAEAGVSPGRIVVQPAFFASELRAGSAPDGFVAARSRRSPLLAMAYLDSPVYGLELMAEAIRQLAPTYPRVGLALFGPGASDENLKDRPIYKELAPFLECFGEVEHSQALGVIQQCDAFVRPTLADGDAISVREALMLGVRCVASDVAIRPQPTWLFRTGDAADLASKLKEALSSESSPASSPDAGPVLLSIYQQLEANRGCLQSLSNARPTHSRGETS